MATRIESRGIQIAAPGGAPMERVVPQQVDYMVAAREQARGAATMADVLDRMSQSVFGIARDMAQEEALKFAAGNPITDEQIQLAKEGLPSAIPGVGKLGSDVTVYGKALQKARMLQLSGHFEIEGRNELTKLLLDVQNGNAKSEDVANKIAIVTDGYSKSLAQIDGEAAIKFRATMATHGNTVLNAAYEAEQKRKKATDLAKLDLDFDNNIGLLEATVSQGFWIDNNGQKRSIDDLSALIQTSIANQSILLGDASIQKEYSERFRVALRNAKISAVTKHLMGDDFMVDPVATLNKIRTGDVGKMSQVLQEMVRNDFEAVAKVTANYMTAVNERETIANRKREADKRAAEGKAIDLLEQIFPLQRGDPKRRDLINQLTTLPPGSTPIGTLEKLLSPKEEGEGNSLTEYNALGGIFDGSITSKEQIDRIPGLTLKQRVSLLRALRSENKSGDAELERGISKLAGISEVPGQLVVLDKNGEEFKRRQELKARVLDIQAQAARDGKVMTERQILNQLEEDISKRRNTEEAKAAKKQLEEFARRPDGSFKPDRDWITGTITKQSLPALRQKAGNDPKKLRQVQEIERLLKLSEGY